MTLREMRRMNEAQKVTGDSEYRADKQLIAFNPLHLWGL